MKLWPFVVLFACSHPRAPHPMPPPPHGEWDHWSYDKRLAYMKSTVLPAEKEIFARFEPIRFAKLDCETCHGASARAGKYAMPNPDLPKLVGGPGGFQELARVQPETLRFMQSVVVPETAKLLGLPPFDMAKHEGFSCYQCHMRADVAD